MKHDVEDNMFFGMRICFLLRGARMILLEPFLIGAIHMPELWSNFFPESVTWSQSNQDTPTRSFFLVPTWKPESFAWSWDLTCSFKVRFNHKAQSFLDQTLQLNWDTSLLSMWKRMRTAWDSTCEPIWGGCLFISIPKLWANFPQSCGTCSFKLLFTKTVNFVYLQSVSLILYLQVLTN